MSEHLNGPWLFREKSESVYSAPPQGSAYQYGEFIFAFHPVSGPDNETLSLILAAPDLLEALEALLVTAENFGVGPSSDSHAMALHAISKAKGESQ